MKIYTMGAVTDRVPESFTWPINYSSYIGGYYPGGTSIIYSERSSQITGISTAFLTVTLLSWFGSSGSNRAIIEVSPDPDFNTVRDSQTILTTENTGTIEIRNNEYFRVGFLAGDNGEEIINGQVSASIGGVSSGTRNIFYDGFIYTNVALSLDQHPTGNFDERYNLSTSQTYVWQWSVDGTVNSDAEFPGILLETYNTSDNVSEVSWINDNQNPAHSGSSDPFDTFVGIEYPAGVWNWQYVNNINEYVNIPFKRGANIRLVMRWYEYRWNEKLGGRVRIRYPTNSGENLLTMDSIPGSETGAMTTLDQVTNIQPTSQSWPHADGGGVTKSWQLDTSGSELFYEVTHYYSDLVPSYEYFESWLDLRSYNPPTFVENAVIVIEINTAIALNQAQVQYAWGPTGPGSTSSWRGDGGITGNYITSYFHAVNDDSFGRYFGLRFKQSTGDRNVVYARFQVRSYGRGAPSGSNRVNTNYFFFPDEPYFNNYSLTTGPRFKINLNN